MQVNYVYEDNSVPSWEGLGEAFVQRMVAQYHFSAVPTQVENRIELIHQLQSMDVTDRAAVTQLRTMKFERGTYGGKEGSIYPIRDLSLSHDRIYCMLEGPTEVAEGIVEEVGELACAAAKVSWKTVQAKHQYVHYATASSESLGVTGMALLSAGMQRFARDVLGSKEIASGMNPRLIGAAPVDPERLNVVVHPYDFQIKVRVANMDTNDVDVHDVRLSIRRIPDHDVGVYLFQSELPSDTHQEVVRRLKAALAR